jgi:hypothetical protein
MKMMSALIALTLACATLPAQAQMMDGKNMMAPTMEQCQGGYKKTYMQSMKWSKAKFKSACDKMMTKDKPMKGKSMMKDKSMM